MRRAVVKTVEPIALAAEPNAVTFLVGPTAAGKSALAMELAQTHGAAILCLDAMQVYRGADIGTGKPTAEDRALIPHGGLDLADVGQPFDVAAYRDHAARFLAEQRAAGRPVLAVGGTGLYYRALTAGLCEAPAAPPELRDEIRALPLAEMTRRLAAADPAILPHLDTHNPRRVARALEVIESTGRSLLDWQRDTCPPLVPRHLSYLILRERNDLRERIARRVDAMLAAGWREEVRTLLDRRGPDALARFAALGYRELAAWLQDGGDFAAVRQKVINVTRQYAKRQLTWFRREPNLRQVILEGMPVIQSNAGKAS